MSTTPREKRKHRRWALACPISVLDGEGKAKVLVLFKTRAVNVSDGGVYMTVPIAELAKAVPARKVGIRLSVPRSTTNSFMLEEFQSQAIIIRSEPLVKADDAGVAMQFIEPLELDLNA
ncbi:MAG: hypothetical protein HQ546_10185 [Planctomycetes bacterium]|nr:hypothetical protein [Planctomycetota bacterium]